MPALVKSADPNGAGLRAPVRAMLIAALLLALPGHVGSPDTWFLGDAGPYRVLVHVRAPGVIPGVAEVTVQVEGDPPSEVLMHVNRFDAVTAPPPPDLGEPVDGRPGTFRTRLWVMTSGSNSVTVQVRGARGEGAVVVPATIVAFRRLELSRPLALALGGFGVALILAFVTIIGAAVRESVLPPGARPDAPRRRAALLAMSGTTALIALVLLGGKRWWDAEDAAYRRSMFRPLQASAQVRRDGTASTLALSVDDPEWGPAAAAAAARAYTPIVEDHGKLMHLFAVREDLGAFAHLHPETTDTVTFSAALPPLPPGRYRIFADLTHESGFSQTLATSAEVPPRVGALAAERGGGSASRVAGDLPGLGGGAADPGATSQLGATTSMHGGTPAGSLGDDAWFTGAPAESGEARLSGGVRVRWDSWADPIVAGSPAPLRFRVEEADGSPAVLEPYMGMGGHAVVVREDGGVFIHLHPMGTISAAAQRAFGVEGGGGGAGGAREAEPHDPRHGAGAAELSFPYAFPSPGTYRVWVQVKRAGEILTAAFPVSVGEADP